jgi:hypothetical protein
MGKKLRKFNRATHRDLGYFFVAMIIIYSISGIAINHMSDWDPNYTIDSWEEQLPNTETQASLDKTKIKELIADFGIDRKYLKHYFPNSNTCKVFVKSGNIIINIDKGTAQVELVKRRLFLHSFNWLHYNPNTVWKWISDIFAVSLIILAISGMFILKGKNGLKWRGTILITLGILLPLIFLVIYYF